MLRTLLSAIRHCIVIATFGIISNLPHDYYHDSQSSVTQENLWKISSETASQLQFIEMIDFGGGIVYDLAWFENDQTLIGAGPRGVKRYDLADVKSVTILSEQATFDVAVHPRLPIIGIAGGDPENITLLNVTTGLTQSLTHGDALALAFSPSGKWLASGSGDGLIKLWDTTTWEEVSAFIDLNDFDNGVQGLAFNFDDTLLASTHQRTDYLWDLPAAIARESPTFRELYGPFDGYSATLSMVAFSPTGQMAVGNSVLAAPYAEIANPTVSTGAAPDLDAPSGLIEALNVFEITPANRDAPISALAYTPDGAILVTACADRMVRVWEAATGRELIALSGHTETIQAIAINAAGTLIATGDQDSTIRLWGIPETP